MSMLANTDEKFMGLALEEARKALAVGDFPVGCVIADGQQVVASGFRTTSRGFMVNEIDHAEIIALRQLSKSPLDFPKERLCIYSTLEPCLMCFGAILISGIHHIVYAFEDVMGGGTRCNRQEMPPLYRDIDLLIVGKVLREESIALMRSFFSNPDNRYLRDTLFARYAMGQTAASVS